MRREQEVLILEKEAFDKVWLMRTKESKDPTIESQRLAAIDKIIETYDDLPMEGYTAWECGYWNGMLAAMRWMMGSELTDEDILDT